MNEKFISKELGCSDLIDFLFNEIKLGYEKGIYQSLLYINTIQEELKNLDNDKKTMVIFDYLSIFKKENLLNNSNRFKHFLHESKKFQTTKAKNIENELEDLAIYIVKYFSAFYYNDIDLINEFKKIKEESFKYFFAKNVYDNGMILFDELKLIDGFKNIEWSYNGLDFIVLHKYNLDNINGNAEIETKNINHLHQIEDINFDIKHLNYDLKASEKEIQLLKDSIDKYYFSSMTLIQDTYFGDNQPLLFELFNFLKKNNCLDYGWSYFYNCFVIGNNEVISLKNNQTNYFFGYLFWAISDFLKPPYKNDKKFFYNKFYIDEKPLKDSFFRNYFRSFKNDEYESIETIAAFIEKLKKTHNK